MEEVMRTPKEFSENLKNKIITERMLELALFSVNKRAKNYRDKKREYRKYWSYGNLDYSEQQEIKEQEMYALKESLLSTISPICVHKELLKYQRNRVYDYDKLFQKKVLQGVKDKSIVNINSYLDGDYYDFNCNEVYFVDIIDRKNPIYNYYLYYEIGEHSFHTPISENELEKFKELYDIEVVPIGRINTKGKDINDLISLQFAKKLSSLIKEGDYSLKLENKKQEKTEENPGDIELVFEYASFTDILPLINISLNNISRSFIDSMVKQDSDKCLLSDDIKEKVKADAKDFIEKERKNFKERKMSPKPKTYNANFDFYQILSRYTKNKKTKYKIPFAEYDNINKKFDESYDKLYNEKISVDEFIKQIVVEIFGKDKEKIDEIIFNNKFKIQLKKFALSSLNSLGLESLKKEIKEYNKEIRQKRKETKERKKKNKNHI